MLGSKPNISINCLTNYLTVEKLLYILIVCHRCFKCSNEVTRIIENRFYYSITDEF